MWSRRGKRCKSSLQKVGACELAVLGNLVSSLLSVYTKGVKLYTDLDMKSPPVYVSNREIKLKIKVGHASLHVWCIFFMTNPEIGFLGKFDCNLLWKCNFPSQSASNMDIRDGPKHSFLQVQVG